MSKKTKLARKRTVQRQDADGVLLSEDTFSEFYAEKEEPYMKFFYTDLSKIFGVAGKELSLFVAISSLMDYKNNVFHNDVRNRDRVCSALKIKAQTYKNGLAALVRTGALKNLNRGVYFVNPSVFAHGEWAKILAERENFKVIINFSNGKKQNVEVVLSKDEGFGEKKACSTKL